MRPHREPPDQWEGSADRRWSEPRQPFGEADAAILTASRISAERRANPGYRSFLANGFNVTRLLVLFFWEVIIEWVAAAHTSARRAPPGQSWREVSVPPRCDVRRREGSDHVCGADRHDAGTPDLVRDLLELDEVAHHSGLERADTLEALRKLDEQFGRLDRARRFAPRPYKIVVLSDHGQTQGATFKQRNGYDLRELVERSISRGRVTEPSGLDENEATVGHAVAEATGRGQSAADSEVRQRDAVVLASGNLGLIYLMEEPRRLSIEEIEDRHPQLLGALRRHAHIGFVMAHSTKHGVVVLGGTGTNYVDEGRVEGEDPLAGFSPGAAGHLRRADGFANAPDVLVNSFYDPGLEQGCAFEELISFHGGLGGTQTRPFILHPAEMPMPSEPIVGAAAVHAVLVGWRRALQDDPPQNVSAQASVGSAPPN